MVRDKDYLNSFKDRMCCIYYTTDTTIAHHVRVGTDGAMGLKPSDCFCIPLSAIAHAECHAGEKKFIEKYSFIFGDDIKEYANNLYKEYLDKN